MVIFHYSEVETRLIRGKKQPASPFTEDTLPLS